MAAPGGGDDYHGQRLPAVHGDGLPLAPGHPSNQPSKGTSPSLLALMTKTTAASACQPCGGGGGIACS